MSYSYRPNVAKSGPTHHGGGNAMPPISYKDLEGLEDDFDPMGPADHSDTATLGNGAHFPDVLQKFAQFKNATATGQLTTQSAYMSPPSQISDGQDSSQRVLNMSQASPSQVQNIRPNLGRTGQLPPGAMSLEELEAQLLGTAQQQNSPSVPSASPPSQPVASMGSPYSIYPPFFSATGAVPPIPPGTHPLNIDMTSSMRFGLIPPPGMYGSTSMIGTPPFSAMYPFNFPAMTTPIGTLSSEPSGHASHSPGRDASTVSKSSPNDAIVPPPRMLPAFMPPNISPEDAARMVAESQELQLHAIKRTRREARMRKNSRFNGIMSQREKDLIARIQISQLVTEDPMADDYYYQLYNKSRSSASNEIDTYSDAASESPLSVSRTLPLSRSNQGNTNRRNQPGLLRRAIRDGSLQDQIDRIVQHAKKKNKSTQFSLDGALGKISLKTTKNPRQQLHLLAVANTSETSPTSSPIHPLAYLSPIVGSQGTFGNKAARRMALKVVEEMHELILKCETLHTSRPTPDSKHTVVVTEDGDERTLTIEEETERWEQEATTARDHLWVRLQQIDDDTHPLIQLLAVSKGKKVWSRLTQLLSPIHLDKLLLEFFVRAQQLDVIRQASIPALYAAPQLFPGPSSSKPSIDTLLQFVGDVEDFMHYVLPSLVTFIAEASWSVVSSSVKAILDRNDVVRMGSSKVGLALLTMLVSRSEILSQLGKAQGWPKLYLRLYNELQGHYLAFFPVSIMSNLPDSLLLSQLPNALIPPMLQQTGSGPTAADILDFYLTDDAHVWQFLASLAVAATVEQQTMLVTEVRERILSNVATGLALNDMDDQSTTASDKAERAIYNVNNFLHALGLDASQIQTAM